MSHFLIFLAIWHINYGIYFNYIDMIKSILLMLKFSFHFFSSIAQEENNFNSEY